MIKKGEEPSSDESSPCEEGVSLMGGECQRPVSLNRYQNQMHETSSLSGIAYQVPFTIVKVSSSDWTAWSSGTVGSYVNVLPSAVLARESWSEVEISLWLLDDWPSREPE